MANLIYSLNATVPVFAVMVAGYFFRRMGMLKEEFVNSANRFNYKITLPVMLFCDMSVMDFGTMFSPKFMIYCVGATLVAILSIWGLSHVFIKDKKIIGSFVQGSYRGSAAVLGVAFMSNIYGDLGIAPMMILASVPIYNVFAVIILTLESNEQKGDLRQRIKKSAVEVCKNPIIIGILLGLPFALLNIKMPYMISQTLDNFARMATPLALVAIGAGFNLGEALKKIKPTLWASAIKLVVQPLLLIPIAVAMGFRNQELVAILIMLGAPATASGYIMSRQMGNDSVLSSGIIVLTTILSGVTITVFVYALKAAALI